MPDVRSIPTHLNCLRGEKKGYDVKHTEWLLNACEQLAKNEFSQELRIDGSCWGEVIREEMSIRMFDSLVKNTSVESIYIKNLTLGLKEEGAFENMLEKNRSVACIKLHRLKHDNSSLAILTKALFERSNLEELEISECKLDWHGCKALSTMIQNSQSLRALRLSNLTFSDKFAGEVEDSVKSKQSDTASQLSSILDSVAGNTSLKSFHVTNSGLGCAVIDSISNILDRNKSLSELKLSYNNLDGECIKHLVENGLCKNSTLKSLSLDHNPIGDCGAIYLAKALQLNKTLKELNLEETEIWEEGCATFSKGLVGMHGLRKLILDGNDFEQSVDIILQSMETNTMLTQLFTSMQMLVKEYGLYGGCDHVRKQWVMVDRYLRLNRANRRILTEPEVPLSLWIKVFENASQEPDTIHYLLSNAPQLFSSVSR